MISKNLVIGTVTLLHITSALAQGKGSKRVGVHSSTITPVLVVDSAVDSVQDIEESNGNEAKPTETTSEMAGPRLIEYSHRILFYEPWAGQDFPKNPQETSSSGNHRTKSLAGPGWLSEVNILIIASAIIIVLGIITCCKRCTCSWKVGEFELTNRNKFLSLHGCFPSACSRGLGGDGED